MIAGSSTHSLDVKHKKNFHGLKSYKHFMLTPQVACTRRWRHHNPLKRRIASSRPHGVTSFFLILSTFYLLIVGLEGYCCTWSQSMTHTRARALGKKPLEEGSARRRYLWVTTHNTHKRQISMPPAGFEPTIPGSERPQNQATDRADATFHLKEHLNHYNPPHENFKSHEYKK
jgi:hypothetical protein